MVSFYSLRRPEIRPLLQAKVSSEMLQNFLLTRLGCCSLECYSKRLVYDFQSHQLADRESTRVDLVRPPGGVKMSNVQFVSQVLAKTTDCFIRHS